MIRLKTIAFLVFVAACYIPTFQAANSSILIGFEAPGSSKILLNQNLPYRGYSFGIKDFNHSYTFKDVNQITISNLSIQSTASCPQFTRLINQESNRYLAYSWCDGNLGENFCFFNSSNLTFSCSNYTIYSNFSKPSNLIYLSKVYVILFNGTDTGTQDLVISYTKISNSVFRINNPITDPVSKSLMQLLNDEAFIVVSLHKETSTIRMYNINKNGQPIGNISYVSPSQVLNSSYLGFSRFDDMTLMQSSQSELYLLVRSGPSVATLRVTLQSYNLVSIFNVTNQDQVSIYAYENIVVAMDPVRNTYSQINLTEITRPTTIQVISPRNCNMTSSLKFIRPSSPNLMLFLCTPVPYSNGTVDPNDYVYVFDVKQPTELNLRTAIPILRTQTKKRNFFFSTATISDDSLLVIIPQDGGGMMGYQIFYSPMLEVNVTQDEYCDPSNQIPRPGACSISFTVSGNPIVSNLAGDFSKPYLESGVLYRIFTIRPPKATQKLIKSAEVTKGKAIFPITGVFNGTIFNATFNTEFFKIGTRYPIHQESLYHFNASLSNAIDLSYSNGYVSILFPRFFASYVRNDSKFNWSLVYQHNLNLLSCSEIYSLGPTAQLYTLLRCIGPDTMSWLYYLDVSADSIQQFINVQNTLITYSSIEVC